SPKAPRRSSRSAPTPRRSGTRRRADGALRGAGPRISAVQGPVRWSRLVASRAARDARRLRTGDRGGGGVRLPRPRPPAPGAAPQQPGGGTVQDSSKFPTPEQLEKLEAAPVPARLFDLDVRSVDTWELAGPFPERIDSEPYTDAGNPWAALVDDAARRRAGLV